MFKALARVRGNKGAPGSDPNYYYSSNGKRTIKTADRVRLIYSCAKKNGF